MHNNFINIITNNSFIFIFESESFLKIANICCGFIIKNNLQ